MNPKFTEVEGLAWGKLLNVHAMMTRRLEEMLQHRYQMSHGEFEVLLRLWWASDNRKRIWELAEVSVLTHSGMSRLIERLVKAGLVRRETATEDKRGACAVITPAGLERITAAEASNIELVKQHFLSLYSEEELKQMGSFWKRFLNYEERLAKNETAP